MIACQSALHFSFGNVSTIFCLPSMISARKLARSMSPFWSQLASIRMPGAVAGVSVRPFMAAPKRLAIEFADFLGDVFHEIDRGVALDAVVVGPVIVALGEFFGELLDCGDRRIRAQADMAAHAVGGGACEFDHLLAQQRGLAEQRRRHALALGLDQEAGAFLLVAVDENGVRLGALQLDDVGAEIDLALLGGDVGHHLDAARLHLLGKTVAAAFAEIIIDPDQRDRSSPSICRADNWRSSAC